VVPKEPRPPADSLRGRLPPRLVDVRDDHARTFLREQRGRRSADASGPARHDRYLALDARRRPLSAILEVCVERILMRSTARLVVFLRAARIRVGATRSVAYILSRASPCFRLRIGLASHSLIRAQRRADIVIIAISVASGLVVCVGSHW